MVSNTYYSSDGGQYSLKFTYFSACRKFGQLLSTVTRFGGAADSDMSDTDKICRQLVLDTQELGRQLAKFGVDATSLPPFKELWTVVAPEGEPLTLQ